MHDELRKLQDSNQLRIHPHEIEATSVTVSRIIDANCNRLAEALRVMEDLARYTVEDASLSAAFKETRHVVRRMADRWPEGWLESARDVVGDVGTGIETADEGHRAGLWDVAAAAGNRAAEAMRTIEEVSKTFDGELARDIETIRYRLYDLDASLRAALASRRVRQWSLCVLISESQCHLPWSEVAQEAIEAGADCLQLREKNLDDARLLERAVHLIELARPSGCSVIINDRVDIALAADADGVHLGRTDLPIEAVRRTVGHRLIIGASTHGSGEARDAVDAGADVCGIGPMYSSTTKSHLEPAGPARLAEFVESHPTVPHLAIGGIHDGRLDELREAGCRGIAVCSAVCGADHPGQIVENLLSGMRSAQLA